MTTTAEEVSIAPVCKGRSNHAALRAGSHAWREEVSSSRPHAWIHLQGHGNGAHSTLLAANFGEAAVAA